MRIIFENEHYLIVDKPAGILVYLPRGAAPQETLRDHLSDKINTPEDLERGGIVHRLDKETSGLLIVAKNTPAQDELKKMFLERSVEKKYYALCEGKMETDSGRINIPLGRDSKDRLKVVPKGEGKQSITEYKVLKYFPKKDVTLMEVNLLTGRTHQIRVHFSAIGHPIVGDKGYSKKKLPLERQFLHAHQIGFKDPFNNKKVNFNSELPSELNSYLQKQS